MRETLGQKNETGGTGYNRPPVSIDERDEEKGETALSSTN